MNDASCLWWNSVSAFSFDCCGKGANYVKNPLEKLQICCFFLKIKFKNHLKSNIFDPSLCGFVFLCKTRRESSHDKKKLNLWKLLKSEFLSMLVISACVKEPFKKELQLFFRWGLCGVRNHQISKCFRHHQIHIHSVKKTKTTKCFLQFEMEILLQVWFFEQYFLLSSYRVECRSISVNKI